MSGGVRGVDRQRRSATHEPARRDGPRIDPAEMRFLAELQLRGALERGEDPEKAAESLRKQAADPAARGAVEDAIRDVLAGGAASGRKGAAAGRSGAVSGRGGAASGHGTAGTVHGGTASGHGTAGTVPGGAASGHGTAGTVPGGAASGRAGSAGSSLRPHAASGADPAPPPPGATDASGGAADPGPAHDATAPGAHAAADPAPAKRRAGKGSAGTKAHHGRAGAGKGAHAGPHAALEGGDLASAGPADRLGTLQELLSGDLGKYASEKAEHDAWIGLAARGSPVAGNVPASRPGAGYRAELIGVALARGGGSGILRGAGEAALQAVIGQAGKRIPYLGGFLEIAQIARDPAGWAEANKAETLGKMSSGWKALSEGGDFITRLEGFVNLLDGVANVLGLVGNICQVVAAALFVGGLILAIFGVGAALLAAAPFIGKAGLVLAEVSSLMKIATMGLRPFLMAARVVQIAVADESPEQLAAYAEGLEKTTGDFAKDFTKARGQKLANKLAAKAEGKLFGTGNSKGAGAEGVSKAAPPPPPDAGGAAGGAGAAKPKSSLANKVANLLTAGQAGEFGDRQAKIKGHLGDLRAGTVADRYQGVRRDQGEAAGESRTDRARARLAKAWATGGGGASREREGGKARAAGDALETAQKRQARAAADLDEARAEAQDLQSRERSLQASLNSKKATTAGAIVEGEERLRGVRARLAGVQGDEARLQALQSSASADLEGRRSAAAEARAIDAAIAGRDASAAERPVVGNVLKVGVKQGAAKVVSVLPAPQQLAKGERHDEQDDQARRRAALSALEHRWTTVPQRLPSPPVADEQAVDAHAARFAHATSTLGQVEFQRQTLAGMDRDAAAQQSGMDVLDRLAQANRARIAQSEAQAAQRQAAVAQTGQQAAQMQQSAAGVAQGGAASGQTPFLLKLAGLLGMVPSGLSSGAAKAARDTQQGAQAAKDMGATGQKAGALAGGAAQAVTGKQAAVGQAQAKTVAARAAEEKIAAEHLAARAEVVDGRSMIANGIALAAQRKAAEEAERQQARDEWQAARKRLMGWALEHERARATEETALEGLVRDAESALEP